MTDAQPIVALTHKVARRIRQWPSKIVHEFYSIKPIRKKMIHDRNICISSYRSRLAPLGDQEAHLADELKRHGFGVSRVGLFDCLTSREFCAACNKIYARIEDHYSSSGIGTEIAKLLGGNQLLNRHFEDIFRAGLDIKLLNIVEHYLQTPVAYGGVDIFFTAADGSESGARRWHKDGEDNPMVKVAVYLNDVGDDDGPLEILLFQQAPKKLGRSTGFRQKKLIASHSRGEVDYSVTSFTGPVGTVIFCDTSKYFHRGKPAVGRNRKALFFNYYSARPLNPYFCPKPPFSAAKMRALVSDLSPVQQNAALWRENLNGLDKIVTKKKPYLSL